jgi:hypothetical protein
VVAGQAVGIIEPDIHPGRPIRAGRRSVLWETGSGGAEN